MGVSPSCSKPLKNFCIGTNIYKSVEIDVQGHFRLARTFTSFFLLRPGRWPIPHDHCQWPPDHISPAGRQGARTPHSGPTLRHSGLLGIARHRRFGRIVHLRCDFNPGGEQKRTSGKVSFSWMPVEKGRLDVGSLTCCAGFFKCIGVILQNVLGLSPRRFEI